MHEEVRLDRRSVTRSVPSVQYSMASRRAVHDGAVDGGEDGVGGVEEVASGQRRRAAAGLRIFSRALSSAAPDAVGSWSPTSSTASSSVSACSGERRAGRLSAGPARSQNTLSLLRPSNSA